MQPMSECGTYVFEVEWEICRLTKVINFTKHLYKFSNRFDIYEYIGHCRPFDCHPTIFGALIVRWGLLKMKIIVWHVPSIYHPKAHFTHTPKSIRTRECEMDLENKFKATNNCILNI